jgi:hypothetical protein
LKEEKYLNLLKPHQDTTASCSKLPISTASATGPTPSETSSAITVTQAQMMQLTIISQKTQKNRKKKEIKKI